jgi:hypothetical protein
LRVSRLLARAGTPPTELFGAGAESDTADEHGVQVVLAGPPDVGAGKESGLKGARGIEKLGAAGEGGEGPDLEREVIVGSSGSGGGRASGGVG